MQTRKASFWYFFSDSLSYYFVFLFRDQETHRAIFYFPWAFREKNIFFLLYQEVEYFEESIVMV